jgi:hypothetical protein
MQFKEESPKQYVDIARVPDEEMRPDCPVPFGVAARTGRGGRSSACARGRRCDPEADQARRIYRGPHAHLRGRIPGNRGPRSTLRRAVCIVARLDHIDIWPAPAALHTVRPGHNASRVYI